MHIHVQLLPICARSSYHLRLNEALIFNEVDISTLKITILNNYQHVAQIIIY